MEGRRAGEGEGDTGAAGEGRGGELGKGDGRGWEVQLAGRRRGGESSVADEAKSRSRIEEAGERVELQSSLAKSRRGGQRTVVSDAGGARRGQPH